jgi:hypothetical protein
MTASMRQVLIDWIIEGNLPISCEWLVLTLRSALQVQTEVANAVHYSIAHLALPIKGVFLRKRHQSSILSI